MTMIIKTLFDQYMVECGILMPYIDPSFSHTYDDIDKVVKASGYAIKMILEAMNKGDLSESCFDGWVEKPVFRRPDKEDVE